MSKSSEIFRKSFDKVAGSTNLNSQIFHDITKYKNMVEDLEGGLADKLSLGDIAVKHKVGVEELTKQFLQGFKKEFEHTKNEKEASEIAMDHLVEDPKYYTKLKKIETDKKENNEATGSGSSGAYSAPLFSGEEPEKVETKEATGSGSVGAYETPAFLAKSTNKKNFRGASKPLYKGGAFVSVKKKCTKFPYCNAGDINALNIYKNESLKETISKISKKYNLNENTIKAILEYEIENLNNKDIYK